MQGAPKFYHPMFRLHRRGWLPTICRFGRSIGSNAIGKIGKLATPKINQMVLRRIVSGDDEKCQFSVQLRLRLSNYRPLPEGFLRHAIERLTMRGSSRSHRRSLDSLAAPNRFARDGKSILSHDPTAVSGWVQDSAARRSIRSIFRPLNPFAPTRVDCLAKASRFFA